MKKFLLKHEVWIFLVLLLIANAVFVTSIVEGLLPEKFYHLGRFALLGAVLFGLIFLLHGFKGVWDVLKPLFQWRRSPVLYLVAAAWTVVLCWVVLLVKGIVTGEYLTMAQLSPGLSKITNPELLRTIAVSSFIGEIVWISYAVRKLSERFTIYVSALIVGFVWTLWWLPMALHNFGIVPNLPLVALLFNQMGIAAMCAFVYHHTRSALLVLVMQFMFNTTILVFPVTPDEGGVGTYWAFALTYFTAATLLFVRFGPGPMLNDSGTEKDEVGAEGMITGGLLNRLQSRIK